MQGRALSQAAFSEVSLSFSQGEEVALRSRGLRIFKNIIPVIMYKEGSGRIVIK